MLIAVVVLSAAVLVLLAGLAVVSWVFVRPSAIYDAMRKQGAAEIARNAAIEETGKQRLRAVAAEADALVLKARAERAEERLRDAIKKYLPHLAGDDLADEFQRLLSGQEPGTDAAKADGPAGPTGPDGLPLQPVDPFANDNG